MGPDPEMLPTPSSFRRGGHPPALFQFASRLDFTSRPCAPGLLLRWDQEASSEFTPQVRSRCQASQCAPDASASMVTATPSSKVNQILAEEAKPCECRLSRSSVGAQLRCLQLSFIAMLKLLFKFDRSYGSQQAGKRRLGRYRITDRSRARIEGGKSKNAKGI